MQRSKANKNSGSAHGAVTIEAVLVFAFLALTLFVVFPPLLNLLNRAALSAQASLAIIGNQGRKTAATRINDGGNVIKAGNTDILAALDGLDTDLTSATSSNNSADVASVSALIRYPSDCVVTSASDITVELCGAKHCCRIYEDAGFQYCDDVANSTDIFDALQNAAFRSVRCRKGDPFSISVAILKDSASAMASNLLSDGSVPSAAPPLQEPRPIIVCGVGSYSGGIIFWGDPDGEVALAQQLVGTESAMSPEQLGKCCESDSSGALNMELCSACSESQLASCAAVG